MRKRFFTVMAAALVVSGILPANIARFENGSRVPTLVVLQKYASALGKRIKVELCDQEAK